MARTTKQADADTGGLDRFVSRSRAALAAAYRAATSDQTGLDPEDAYARSVEWIVRLLAILVAAAQMPPRRPGACSFRTAADALCAAVDRSGAGGSSTNFLELCRAARDCSGLGIFDPDRVPMPFDFIVEAARALLRPANDSTIDLLFFQTVPLWWLGCAYEAILALRPSEHPGELRINTAGRKRRGVYFTPPALVDYVTCRVLEPLVKERLGQLKGFQDGSVLDLRILDPAMGGGAFLARAVEFLGAIKNGRDRAQVAADCVYGVDVDRVAVEIARFAVWAASGYAEGVPVALNGHLICGDALAGNFPVPTPRKAGHSRREFDAVVGNPPYVASKNRLLDPRRGRGQSDSYLMFLTTVLERGLVRPGGVLSMVLPDPMLVRQNAASIRCKLAGEWTIESILHIFGAFPDAVVANIVPVVRNLRPASETFYVSRIERAADRRNFAINPCATALELARPVRRQVVLAQKRCEFLYLLEEGPFAGIIRRIHGPGLSLAEYQPPFVPLCRLNVRAIYRGEEVGKSAITRRKGELRMLLGGESVQPYEIIWGGHRVAAERVVKPLSRYGATKVLIQKSAGRVVAALDEVRKGHRGYVFPQSVYAVELTPEGVDHLYLLCILNSQVINEYVRRTVTAYKMVQPQLELEDIRSLPIRRISFTTAPSTRAREVVRALSIFDDECLRAAENMHFPELANFVGRYLSANPEMSDVVHDILVRLGRLAVDLTRTSRKSPEPGVTHRLECVRAAIEAVVWKLYSTDPAQMALAL